MALLTYYKIAMAVDPPGPSPGDPRGGRPFHHGRRTRNPVSGPQVLFATQPERGRAGRGPPPEGSSQPPEEERPAGPPRPSPSRPGMRRRHADDRVHDLDRLPSGEPVEAPVGLVEVPLLGDADLVGLSPVARLDESLDAALELRQRLPLEVLPRDGAAAHHPQRAEESRPARHHDALPPEPARQLAGVERPGAAERHQPELRRVVAAL